MTINPYDPRASSPEKIVEQFGDLIKTELYEIGYAYIGKREFNCDENREATQKRFKVTDQKIQYGINLWYGTSKWVDCKETSDKDEQENPTREIAGKDTYLSICIAQLDNKLDIIFDIVDNLDILNSIDWYIHKELDNINDLLVEINMIKTQVLEHSKKSTLD